MFPFFPYTNFHRLNADWILEKVKELATTVDQLRETVAQAVIDTTNSVKFTIQQLTQEQQTTARNNISAAPRLGVVYYNQSMTIDEAYKAQARQNIGAAASAEIPVSAVLYTEQSLTEAQKAQARTNIGAGTGGGGSDNAVLYTEQSLTAAQQTQARANIGAADAQLEQTVSDLNHLKAPQVRNGV